MKYAFLFMISFLQFLISGLGADVPRRLRRRRAGLPKYNRYYVNKRWAR